MGNQGPASGPCDVNDSGPWISIPESSLRRPYHRAHHSQANHTPCILHPTPYTLHPTPYTLHPTPSSLKSKPPKSKRGPRHPDLLLERLPPSPARPPHSSSRHIANPPRVFSLCAPATFHRAFCGRRRRRLGRNPSGQVERNRGVERAREVRRRGQRGEDGGVRPEGLSWIQGLRFRAQGLRSRVEGLGFRV